MNLSKKYYYISKPITFFLPVNLLIYSVFKELDSLGAAYKKCILMKKVGNFLSCPQWYLDMQNFFGQVLGYLSASSQIHRS